MASDKQRNITGVNVGTSSLLLVFVVMCLVSFATLATVSANADRKLSEKIVDRTGDYYNACNEAELRIADIDSTLRTKYESGLSRDDYFAEVGQSIDFSVPVSDVQTLSVSLDINYPAAPGDTFYDVTKWKLETTGTLTDEAEEPAHLNLLF